MRVVNWELLCILKMVVGLNRGWGKILSWQAFSMLCRHTVMSMQMTEVRWAVYWVTVAVGDGIDVIMAWWNAWRLSDSLCPPKHFVIVAA